MSVASLDSLDARVAPAFAILAESAPLRARIQGALARPESGVLATQSLGGADGLVVQCDRIGVAEVARLRELRSQWPQLRIVVVCAAAGARHTRRAVDGGADGLVLADRLEDSLAPTIAAVLAGQVVVPSEFGASVRKQPLSFREKQILSLVTAGYTNGQISSELFLAESTVKSHLSSAFVKLGVSSRSEAAALVLDPRESAGLGIAGIIDPIARFTRTRG